MDQEYKQFILNGSIFYELKITKHDKIGTLKNKKEIISSKKEDLKSTKADWRPVYNDLHA